MFSKIFKEFAKAGATHQGPKDLKLTELSDAWQVTILSLGASKFILKSVPPDPNLSDEENEQLQVDRDEWIDEVRGWFDEQRAVAAAAKKKPANEPAA